MKALCLPRGKANAIKQALKSGDISIESLYKMDSGARQLLFKNYVGRDFAPTLNAKFEQAMLSNQKKAMANWVKQVTKPKEPARRDMMKRVEGLEKALANNEGGRFFADLAEMKLGVAVTEEEATNLLQMAKLARETKEAIPQEYLLLRKAPKLKDTPIEVYRFAVAQDNFVNYSRELITKAEQPTVSEYLKYRQFDAVVDMANAMKSTAASIDISFMGRQGINLLFKGRIKEWGRGMSNNVKVFGKTLFEKQPGLFQSRSDAAMRATMIDIYRQPNYLNGKYNAARDGYGLGVTKEEAFPSSLPGRVPILGRFFHASENAFNTTALTLRKELANTYIELLERSGQDVYDPDIANGLSRLVLSSTGRGPLGRLGVFGKELNALFFSVRYWSALLDTMTLNQFGVQNPEVRKLAAKEGLKMYASLAALYATYYTINNDSVPWLKEGGANSSDFGRIKVTDNIQIDPTGGMSGHMRVMAQLASGWKYNGKDYTWQDLDEGGFASESRWSVFSDYVTGKGSPFVGALGESITGKKFGGEETNTFRAFLEASTPITSELIVEELQKGESDAMVAIILEAFGVSPYPTTMGGYGDRWLQIKEKVDDPATFYQITQTYTDRYQKRANQLRNSGRWENLTLEERNKELEKIKREEVNRIYTQYGVK